MAFLGYGVWALITGSLAGSLVNLLLLWLKSPWRPSLEFDFHIANRLMRFGLWILGESLIAWGLIWGDKILVAKYMSTRDLGIYRAGWTISEMVFGLLLSSFLPVLYTAFSRLQGDIPKLKDFFRMTNRIVIALAFPVGTILLLLGPQAASLFFGEKWHGLGMVLGVIGFMHGIGWLVGINSELYRAMGRPDLNTKLSLFAVLYYLPALLLAAPLGLWVFTYTRLAVALLAIPIHIHLCVRMLGLSYLYIWNEGKHPILATFMMAIVVTLFNILLASEPNPPCGWIILALLLAGGALSYLGTLWLLDRLFLLQAKRLFMKAAFG